MLPNDPVLRRHPSSAGGDNNDMMAPSLRRAGVWQDFQLLQPLGRGSTASAWLALRRGTAGFSKLVVLKFLAGPANSRSRLLMEREAVALSRMNHPNVVQIHDVVEHDGERALVMEYLEGKSLMQLGWPLCAPGWPSGLALRILHDTLIGLEHVHNARDHDGSPLSMVHSDISPNNVLVSYAGQVKVIDFGLARTRGSGCGQGGTPRYMAPERWIGDPLTPAADIYGVGAMLWEVLAQQRLWDGYDRNRLRSAILAGQVQSPLLAVAHTPSSPTLAWLKPLETACLKALSYFPEARFSTSREFAEALAASPLASQSQLRAHMHDAHGPEREAVRKQIAVQLKGHSPAPAAEPAKPPPPQSTGTTPALKHTLSLTTTAASVVKRITLPALLGVLAVATYHAISARKAPSPPPLLGESTTSHPASAAHRAAPPASLSSLRPHSAASAIRSTKEQQQGLRPAQETVTQVTHPDSSQRPAKLVPLAPLRTDAIADRPHDPTQGAGAPSLPRSVATPASTRTQPSTEIPSTNIDRGAQPPTPCSPSYVYTDGIKRFKPECFRGAGKQRL